MNAFFLMFSSRLLNAIFLIYLGQMVGHSQVQRTHGGHDFRSSQE